jgi:hypothetical protein
MYSIIYNNQYDFAYKLYNEVEGTEMAYTIDDRYRIILIHYWKLQIIPRNIYLEKETTPIQNAFIQNNQIINIIDINQ